MQVEAEERTVSVRGEWNLSQCGELRFEFAAGDAPAAMTVCKVMLANEGAVMPDREYHHSEGVYAATALLKPGQRSFTLPIPPAMPEFQSVVRRLYAVDVTGLFYLVWPHPMWTYKEAGGGNNIYSWTLDARKVVSCMVACPWKPGVKPSRIEATGTANTVSSWPDFAKRTPEEFFPFIDRYGQFKWRDWPGKIHGDAELKASIAAEDADLAAHPAPADHDRWGGWKDGPRFEATGAFYVKKVEGKWWFVDPDGRLWWSHGPLRVSPSCGMTPVHGCGHPKTPYFGREHYFEELPADDSPLAVFYRTRDELMWPYYIRYGVTNTYDFTSANLYRKHGAGWFDIWADRVHRRLRSWGANTIANSSDIRVMRLSRTPYCDRFELKSRPIAGTEKQHGWWPFRDPFDPSFVAFVREQMAAHKAEMDDPWCFGFFVDNELTWGKSGDLARWTWESPDDQPAKIEFKRRLAAKYGCAPETPSDDDFAAFSLEIAEAYFRNVRDTFKACAPKKLYMGCRFSGAPEAVVRIAAKYVDVMSYNYYERDVKGFNRLPPDIDKPVIIGEFHFGSLDRGPFRPGLVMTRDQAERGEIYRRYLTSALEDPRFVGVHWHQYADDVATGRFDGENLQNGWVDICDNPYPETIEAVRWVGANMYRIRAAAKGTDVACATADQRNAVRQALDDYVLSNRIAGVVSIMSDADNRLTVDCSGWANVERRIPISTNTLFAIFSMTKTFTGAAMMCAIDDGKISLDDRVSKYLPEYADIRMEDGSVPKRELTLRDVLSHTDGMRWEYPLVNNSIPLREAARMYAAHPMRFQPGETFEYGTMRFSVAAACLEVAVGERFEDYLKRKILDPLEMKDTTFSPNASQLARLVTAYTSNGLPLRRAADRCSRQLEFPKEKPLCPAPGGGLFSTPADVIRFSQMLAHHGEREGVRVITRKTFDEVFSVVQVPGDLGERNPYTAGSWVYGDWFGHEGAMRTDQRANLKTGQSRLFFIQTENKAGPDFFALKRSWHDACDAMQGTSRTEFGH